MQDDLISLLSARNGHYLFESGHHGDLWLDLDALFARPAPLKPFISALGARLVTHEVDAVCGPMSSGAFVAYAIATELDLPFFFTQRVAERQLDGSVVARYNLSDTLRERARGKRVAVVDDVINAGSATGGTLIALDAAGAEAVAIGALLVLGDPAGALAARRGIPLERIAWLPNAIWTPADCPLCASGIPLENLLQ